MGALGQTNHQLATSRRFLKQRGAIASVAALVASLTTGAVGLDINTAAAQTTTCGDAPSGYNIIESDSAAIKGTRGNDFICGGPSANSISGLAGDDIIIAGGGNDRVAGGKGNDIILGGPGKDKLRGGGGDDVLQGEDGDDLIKGQPGNDVLFGGDGDDDLRAGPGTDTANGGGGNDVVNGQGGNDTILGGNGNDVLRGKNGSDILDGGDGADRANGGRGADDCQAEELLKCEDDADTGNPEPPVDPPVPPVDPPAPPVDPPAPPVDPPAPPVDPPAPPVDPPAPPVDPDPEMTILVDTVDTILADHGQTHPWLVAAWDYISTNGDVVITDLPGGSAGLVNSNCSFSTAALPDCGATTFTMDQASLTNQGVVIHELAHVYEGTLALHASGGAFAKAQLYFDNKYGDGCDYAEVMADAMLHDVDPDAFLFYWEVGCASAVPNQPTAGDLAILQAGLGGGSGNSAWFDQNYANGAQAWTGMFDTHEILSFYLVTGLRDEFGGYCSVNHTMNVVFDLQDDIVSDNNPFADGGC